LHGEYPDPAYRTGDLGRWLPSGELEFLGRIDRQVKLRGMRVELEEIEAALLSHPAVGECAVTLREEGEGDQRLVAYAPKAEGLAATELRAFLEERLPAHMVPSAYVFPDALPRTASGKVDRRRLPAPDSTEAHAGREYVAPRTALEAEVAEVWGELLRVERVGATDNFFQLGGHSLLAAQMINALRRRFAVELPLRRFMESPTVADVAQSVEAARMVGHEDLAELASLLEHVQGLSDEEVKALLDEAEQTAAPGVA
jgi:acyl carrier protein